MCLLLPTGSRPGIGTYAGNVMTCRCGSRSDRELATWRTVGETGLRALPDRDFTGLLSGLEGQAGGMTLSSAEYFLGADMTSSFPKKRSRSRKLRADQSAYRMTLLSAFK